MSGEPTDPPAGLAPEILAAALAAPADAAADGLDLGCDAYALWAAMTRLAHEVKLQGRTFAALRENLEKTSAPTSAGAGAETAVAALSGLKDEFVASLREAGRLEHAARQRAAQAEEELLTTLADIYERLARGAGMARDRLAAPMLAATGWRRWFGGGEVEKNAAEMRAAVASLLEGQELAQRRVLDELTKRGLREMAALGEAFDPLTMRAVAVDASGKTAAGTVTAVARRGWTRNGAIWRYAEVTVAQ